MLKVQEEVYFGTLPVEMAYTLNNLGICYRKLEQYDKAEEAYNKQVEVLFYINPDRIQAYATLYEACITLYLARIVVINLLLDHPTAGRQYNINIWCYLNRALQIKINALGEVHFDVAAAYINFGNLAMNREQWEQSVTYSEKAIDIYEVWTKSTSGKQAGHSCDSDS